MIRVAHIITGLAADGAERMLQNLVMRMDRRRFSNEVISLTSLGDLGREMQLAGIPVQALELTKSPASLGGVSRMQQHLRATRPNVVQTWMYHADLLGGLVARWSGIPGVVWGVHHMAVHRDSTKLTTVATAKLCAWLSKAVPKRIVYCSAASRESHAAFGYRGSSAEWIPNGFDTELFRPNPAGRRRFRARIGAGDSDILVGMAARFHPHKDHANLLAAAEHILARYPHALFVLCGRDVQEDCERFQSLAKHFDLRGRVRLLGPINEMPEFLAAMDVLVSSSLTEAFPLTVGEGMSCGVPCVVTAVGDSALLVGETGVVVPPAESTALAAAIERLLLSSDLRIALGTAARSRIQRMFSLDATVARYEELYSRALLS